MKVTTESDRIERHRRVLYGLYAADHHWTKMDCRSRPPMKISFARLCEHTTPLKLEPVEAPRVGRPLDVNPYIEFDPELCILCARCTRYCDEVEAVNAITLAYRGSETTISTAGERGLMDTTCELCGGCIDTCPTGALIEKKAPKNLVQLETRKTRTTCNFCGVGCQLDLHVHNDRVVKVTSPAGRNAQRWQPVCQRPLCLRLHSPRRPTDRTADSRRGRRAASGSLGRGDCNTRPTASIASKKNMVPTRWVLFRHRAAPAKKTT